MAKQGNGADTVAPKGPVRRLKRDKVKVKEAGGDTPVLFHRSINGPDVKGPDGYQAGVVYLLPKKEVDKWTSVRKDMFEQDYLAAERVALDG